MQRNSWVAFRCWDLAVSRSFRPLLDFKNGILLTWSIERGLKLLIGLPNGDYSLYDADDSGIRSTPAPGSHVEPRNRINFLRHTATAKFFNAPNVNEMTSRFLDRLGSQLAELEDIGTEWVEYPDFSDFIHKQVFRAATYSMCGPYLLSLNPSFVEDFAEYISYLPTYVKAVPRWMNPRAYAVRERLLEAYKKWHKFAREHSPLEDQGRDTWKAWEPYWGTRLMRERNLYAVKSDGMSADSCAAEDLGILFA